MFLKDVEEITHKENEVYGEKDLAELGEYITVTFGIFILGLN